MERFQGKVAVVTGASSGIGEAIARKLIDNDMQVVACARRAERLATLKEALGDRLHVRRADLRNEADILAVFEHAESLGGADVLVNNAGLGREAPLMTGETERWREMLEVNVLALCIATRQAVKSMQRRGVAGHVVHISSMASHRVPPNSGVYSASKYAVRSLTEGLRKELREAESPIRVTAISPGFVRTEFHHGYFGDDQRAEEAYSRFEVLTADDVASAVVYALGMPARAEVHDILLRPTAQRT